MKIYRKLLLTLCSVVALFGTASAQTQMLLPYNSPIFQSTWEQPAVRPWFRFSIGLPVISSVEVGAINNNFALGDVAEVKDNRFVVVQKKLFDEIDKHENGLIHAEASVDLFHFRMQWRDWFFWLGARNNTQLSLLLTKDFLKLVGGGNEQFVGGTINMTNTRLDQVNYHELSFGFSRLMERWSFGLRASLLTGQLNSHLVLNKAEVAISSKDQLYKHTFNLDGSLYTSSFPKGSDGNILAPNKIKWRELNYFNLNNPGFAFAGGLTFKPERNTTLELAVSDVGMIFWRDDLATFTPRDGKDYVFQGFEGFDRLFRRRKLDWDLLDTEGVEKRLGLDSVKKVKGEAYRTWLSPKGHFIVKYKVARATELGGSFSAIYHQGQFYPSGTFTVMQGISDIFFAQAAISYNQRSFLNVGGSLVFNPGPLQFYVVCDNILGIVNPKMLKATNVRLGMNIILGPRYSNMELTRK